MRIRRSLIGLVVAVICCASAGTAVAHWCSNIFVTRARIVVKPEKTTVVLPSPLRVYLQNNYPYKIDAYMRATVSGSTVYPTPTHQTVQPGQNVSFVFSLTGSGSTQVSTLNLQMKFRSDGASTDPNNWPWRSESDSQLNQNPTQSALISDVSHGQSGSLSAAMLFERYPSATLGSSSPWFGRTGLEQLIKWFGYRFCWNENGSWRCGSQDCPTPCAEGSAWGGNDVFAQLCFRAGAEVGARKAQLGSSMTEARNAAVNALKGGGSAEHKCLAAVVGGYLWEGVTATSFTTELANSANNVSSLCQNAGLRALGQGTSSGCTSGQYYERAACAAAEGLQNNNGPVTSVLMPNAGDGTTGASGYNGLYYAYMLYIVQAHRKATTGYVPFYPDAGGATTGCTTAGDCNDNNPCTTDTCSGGTCQNTPISGCCTAASQCDDSDPCTNDTCVSNVCQHSPISGCCTAASQCNDSDPCTSDNCVSNVCQNNPISGCCTTNSQCDDGNNCTNDTCVSNVCQHSPISGCCTSDADCNDNNPCTTDTCNTSTGVCTNAQQSGCCAFDTDCDDSDPCTTDTCDTSSNTCQHGTVTGCCKTDADCDDIDPCTADTCDTTTNTCSYTPVQCDGGVPDVGTPQDYGLPGDIGGVSELGPGSDQGGPGLTSSILEGGCGCAVARAADRAPHLALVLLLVALALVRRRR
jgi:MYXO-CTERM domain-containing protein